MGLTEEQKKLFSYFVPVRGMSEQIVEVLDNDRRAQREGTSKTGNILVIGHKGSGKTVLSVDIVKAIQKQRNLKQGKVAIVTGGTRGIGYEIVRTYLKNNAKVILFGSREDSVNKAIEMLKNENVVFRKVYKMRPDGQGEEVSFL